MVELIAEMVGSRAPRATRTSKPAARAWAAIEARSALLPSAIWVGLVVGARQGRQRRRRLQILGILADHAPVILLAGL